MEHRVQIQKPTFKIYKNRVLSNLRYMMLKAETKDADLHPHYKTHQSAEVGFWAKGEGIRNITVSSAGMAEEFTEQAYQQITIAFPVNRLEIDTINRLAEHNSLMLTVVSESSVEFLDKELEHPVKIALKVDAGYHRAGIEPDNKACIEKILKICKRSDKLKAHSFMAHTGQNYHTNDKNTILKNHAHTVTILEALKNKYGLKTSLGDTPACSMAEEFGNTDIWRPGNFMYYDLMQYMKGACHTEDIAVSVVCPVTAKSRKRRELVLYGGAVHFSKEYLTMPDGKQIYGLPVIRTMQGDEIPDNSYLKSLSQEHGILKCSESYFNEINEGDLVEILPVHSCLTANLMLNSSLIV